MMGLNAFSKNEGCSVGGAGIVALREMSWMISRSYCSGGNCVNMISRRTPMVTPNLSDKPE